MEEGSTGSKGELTSGYKLVPWLSWYQWSFVSGNIFSTSHDSVSSALRRISAWRSRGCLPIPIEVTVAFIDIQQKDPFFKKGAANDVLPSEEILAMLYSMAITRLVNGYVEQTHKKTGRSISELADAAGIPRILVDIRHESSHRNLPSLPLLRLASIKALEWLKFNYWEPQKNAIPDVRVEIRSRLLEMTCFLKAKRVKATSTDIKGRRAKRSLLLKGCNKLSSKIAGQLQASRSSVSEKRISRAVKKITRLYSAYPSEVVSVLLDFFQLHASNASNIVNVEIQHSDVVDVEMQHSDNSDVDESRPPFISINKLKTVITKLSSKEPRLLLSILKAVIELIEAEEDKGSNYGENQHIYPSSYQNVSSQTKYLCPIIPWLIKNLKALKDSGLVGYIEGIGDLGAFSVDKNAILRFSPVKLLQKLLSLLIPDDKDIIDSIKLLVEMIGDGAAKERLKKLPLLCSWNCATEDPTFAKCDSLLIQADDSLEKAQETMEFIKQHSKKKRNRDTDSICSWSVSKSWIPCPIGMLPCSFSSTAVLPVLDVVDEGASDEMIVRGDERSMNMDDVGWGDSPRHFETLDEDDRAVKRLRRSPERTLPDSIQSPFPMEGMFLFGGGVWKKVTDEELISIQSNTLFLPLFH